MIPVTTFTDDIRNIAEKSAIPELTEDLLGRLDQIWEEEARIIAGLRALNPDSRANLPLPHHELVKQVENASKPKQQKAAARKTSTPRKTTKTLVMDAIEKAPMNISELAQETGKSEKAVLDAVKQLTDSGRLRIVRRREIREGVYSNTYGLPEKVVIMESHGEKITIGVDTMMEATDQERGHLANGDVVLQYTTQEAHSAV